MNRELKCKYTAYNYFQKIVYTIDIDSISRTKGFMFMSWASFAEKQMFEEVLEVKNEMMIFILLVLQINLLNACLCKYNYEQIKLSIIQAMPRRVLLLV